MSRITLTVTHSSAGKSPAERWYHCKGQIDASFGVHASEGRWVSLMGMTLPRDLSALVPDPDHPAGAALKLNIDWQTALAYDFAPLVDCFPQTVDELCDNSRWLTLFPPTRAELIHQRLTLLTGWTRLVAIHLAGGTNRLTLPGLEQQASFWEEYLFEEMCDVPYLGARRYGAAKVIANADDRRQYNNWLRIASCAAEVLWQAPEARTIFAAARVAPHLFPCLNAGLAEARKHGGIA
jgi:hypothetical protein